MFSRRIVWWLVCFEMDCIFLLVKAIEFCFGETDGWGKSLYEQGSHGSLLCHWKKQSARGDVGSFVAGAQSWSTPLRWRTYLIGKWSDFRTWSRPLCKVQMSTLSRRRNVLMMKKRQSFGSTKDQHDEWEGPIQRKKRQTPKELQQFKNTSSNLNTEEKGVYHKVNHNYE